MRTHISIFLLASLFTFVASCSTDDPDDDNTDNTPSSQAVANLSGGDSKPWKLKTEKLNGTDVTAGYKPCELDNAHIFDNIDNYTIDAGDTKCTPPEEDLVRGQYKFNDDETELQIEFPDTSFVAKITTLTSDKMVWEITTNENYLVEKTFVPLK